MSNFVPSAQYPAFSGLCRDLRRCTDLTNRETAKAVETAILGQIKQLTGSFSAADRIAAAEWLWETYLDVPPFDQVFVLLNSPA